MSRGERYPKVRRLRTAEAFRARLEALGLALPFDEELASGPDAPLARPMAASGHRIGNRFAILPMEGWDGTADGRPTELVRRRWRRFGESGAKLIWGGEAVAVRADGRANPNQLRIGEDTADDIASLRRELVDAHEAAFGASDDLLVGLQLTHSGRFARPEGAPAPRVAYRHPVLDARVGIEDDAPVFSDDELDALVEDFVAAGRLAAQAGYAFVDVKHCHGYLGHELLTAIDRPGRYGGADGRTRFLESVVAGLRAAAPDLAIGVRLSAYDFLPFRPGADGIGEPEGDAPYRFAFGGDGSGLGIDLDAPDAFLTRLEALGIELVCITAGSPYYNPHIQRPAYFPPSDGYRPPEDPLVGVARMEAATAELKRRHPDLVVVGSGYSYLQEWLPHVGQRAVADRRVDAIGLGRMALSYPTLPADVLAGRPLARGLICRTFSDCTTAPRNGMVSGCYPLDAFYKEREEAPRVAALRSAGA